MLRRAITEHTRVLRPGAFLAINFADVLCFNDVNMLRLMADNVSRCKRADITREHVMHMWTENPGAPRK